MAHIKVVDKPVLGMGTIFLPANHGIGHVNELHVCTYEESHVIYGEKYLDHIAKCRQRKEGKTVAEEGEGDQMLICTFNPRHHVHYLVMDKHIEICDGYYKHQMDKQLDPPSMAETFRRYNMIAPVTDPDPDIVDDTSLYGEGDGDAPIYGVIKMLDVRGKVVVPKTRNEFRKVQGKIAKKLVMRKLREMSTNKDSSPDSSRASTPHGVRYGTLEGLPEMSFVEKMKNVADFADKARERLESAE